MASLLWEHRAQVGCCLLIQASLLGVGLGLERWVPHTPSPSGAEIARTRA